MEKSIQFYQGLGLIQIVATDDLHYSRFLSPEGNSTFSLERVESVSQKQTKCKILKAAGYDFESEPTDKSWLWREAYLTDPDGNKICLYYAGENRINPPWRLR